MSLKTLDPIHKEKSPVRRLPHKIVQLQERLGVAIDAKATRQATIIREKIKKEYISWRIENECPYPEVNQIQAKKEMCTAIASFPGVTTWDRMRQNFKRCGFRRCWQDEAHTHNAELLCETLNSEGIEIPYAALIRLREAQDKKLFDTFEIWRPVAELPVADPWLIGRVYGRFFKICAWI